MTHRDIERARAKALAALEPLNTNGFNRDISPPSTRTIAEARRTAATPDPAPAPRDHEVAAGTASISYVTSVRDHLERTKAKTPEPTPAQAQDANAASWLDYNEAYRRKHGHYPSN